MSDSAASPQPHGIEQDFDVIDSALTALASDDLEAAEALAAGLGNTPAEPGAPAEPGTPAEPGPDGGGSEQPSPDRPG